MEQFLRDFGTLMRAHEGKVFGTFNFTFPKASLDGSDLQITLPYPDWSKIGSIPAKR